VQNVKVPEGSTIINKLDCTPKRAEDRFILKYVWLDEITSSLLLANYFPPSLSPIVGSIQNVLRNSVYERLRNIVIPFGYRVKPDTDILKDGLYYSLLGRKSEAPIENIGARPPLDVLQRLIVYDGSDRIFWPDSSALTTLFKTQRWPDNYKMTYRKDYEQNIFTQDEGQALDSVILYKTITKDEFINYTRSVEKFEDAVSQNILKIDNMFDPHSYTVNLDASNLLKSHTVASMLNFGDKNWPDDFILAFLEEVGLGCTGYSVQFYLLPRHVFTLVAVIEAVEGPIEIQQVRFDVDPDETLHVLREGSKVEDAGPGAIILKKGETLIIPLRNELRYDLDIDPFLDLNDRISSVRTYKAIMYKAIMNTNRDVFRFVVGKETIFSKLKKEFRKPEPISITRSYVFGQSLDMKA
jgi:hypothetical protein